MFRNLGSLCREAQRLVLGLLRHLWIAVSILLGNFVSIDLRVEEIGVVRDILEKDK